nr:hypothetical protein [Pelagibacterales bacterium]
MSKVLGKYELDKITERLELIIQFAKIVSKKNKIYSISKSNFLSTEITDGKILLIFDNNLSLEFS